MNFLHANKSKKDTKSIMARKPKISGKFCILSFATLPHMSPAITFPKAEDAHQSPIT